MVTMVGKTEDTAEGLLSNLIKLDYDAAEAYEAAINRLENEKYKTKLRAFHQDHIRHTENLGQILQKMHKNVPTGPDEKRFLTQGKVVLANLFGDKAILRAMRSNEDDTNTAYENALKHEKVTPEIRKILEENLKDERNHRKWIMDEIEKDD